MKKTPANFPPASASWTSPSKYTDRRANLLQPADGKKRRVVKLVAGATLLAALAIESLALLAYAGFIPGNWPSGRDAVLPLLAIQGLIFASFLLFVYACRRDGQQAVMLDAVLNGIAEGVLVLDGRGNFLGASPALLAIVTEDELRQMSFGPFEKTWQWRRKAFKVSTICVPEIGSVVIFKDHTRCHETERARDALFAIVSHELRTPLAVVMNYLEMLLMLTRMKKMDDGTYEQHLTRALDGSRRLQRLIVNILDLAKIQAGALELKREHIQLAALLEESTSLAKISIHQKDLEYKLTIAPDVPEAFVGDSDRLQQALMNLLDNEVKFTSRGEIRVSVYLSQKDLLAIEVADTGFGIPEEQLPDIFEAFRRASNYAQREHPGAGLGLSIAKEIIVRMGGDISVSSATGEGSTFTVLLPLEEMALIA